MAGDREVNVKATFTDEMSGRLEQASSRASKALIGGFAAIGAGVAGGLGVAVKTAADFEQTLSAVGALGPQFADNMDALSAKALQIGKDTAFSSVQAAGAMEELAKAGVSATAILGGAADATVALAAAGGIEMANAASIMSAAINQFGLNAADATHVSNLLAGAASSSATDVGAMGESLKNVGAQANLVGFSIEDTTTSLALLAKQGITGGAAGTALSAALRMLAKPSDQGAKLMSKLGIEVFNASGVMKTGAELSGELKTAMAGLTTEAKAVALGTIFGEEGLKGGNALMLAGTEGFKNLTAEIAKISAADVAAAKLDNLKGSITILKGSTETLAVMIGMAFQGPLQAAVEKVTLFINALMPLANLMAAHFPAVFAAFSAKAALVFDMIKAKAIEWQGVLIPVILAVAAAIGLSLVMALANAGAAVAMFGIALVTNGIIGLLSFVGVLVTTVVPAIITFGTILLTQGLGAALGYAGGMLMSVLPANAQAGASFIGTALTAVGSFVMMLGSALINFPAMAAVFITTTLPALLTLGAQFVLTKVDAVLSFGMMLAGAVTSAAGMAAAFLTTTVPSMVTTAAGFVVTAATAAASFLIMLNGALLAAPGMAVAFLTTTVPAMVTTAVGFVTTAATSVVSFATMLAGAISTGIGIAAAFLTTVIPATIAVGAAIVSFVAGAAVAFFGLLMSAISAGIGIVIAFWPIILVGGLIIAALVWVWKNWAKIWQGIKTLTGKAVGLIGGIFSKFISGAVSLIKTGLSFMGKIFHKIFGKILEVGKEWVGKLRAGIVGGFEAMVNKVMDGIRWLADKIGGALSTIAEAASNFVKSLPGGEQIMGIIGGGSGGFSAAISVAVETFKAGGDEGGGSFITNLANAIDAGLSELGFESQLGALADKMMPDAAGAGEDIGAGIGEGIGDGLAGAGAGMTGADAVRDMMGGAGDGAGAGAKGPKSPKAKKGKKAAKKTLRGDESLDLAKAFTEAIDEAVKMMNDLVSARIPERAQYMPVLDRIRDFFIDVQQVFKTTFQDALTASEKVTDPRLLNADDLDALDAWAKPFTDLLKTIGTAVDIMTKLNGLKVPDMSVMAHIEKFLTETSAIGKRILALLTKDQAETLGPVAEALGKMAGTIGAGADSIRDLQTLVVGAGIDKAVSAVEDFLRGVATFGGSLVKGDGYDLTKETAKTKADLSVVSAVFETLESGAVMLASAAASITEIAKGRSASPEKIAAVQEFVRGVAALSSSLVRGEGYDLTLTAERSASDLAVVRDVLTTIGAGVDLIAKAAKAITDLAKVSTLATKQFDMVRIFVVRTAAFGASLLRGDGYDLTKNATQTREALGLVQDVFTSIGSGVDMIAKAAGAMVSLGAVTRVVSRELDMVRLFVLRLNAFAVSLIKGDGYDLTLDPARTAHDLEVVRDVVSTIAVGVEMIAKAAAVDLSKATLLTYDAVNVVRFNTIKLLNALASVKQLYTDSSGNLAPVLEDIKEFSDHVGTAFSLMEKAATLSTDWAKVSLIPNEALDLILFNVDTALYTILRIKAGWQDAKGGLSAALLNIKEFADLAGGALEFMGKAAGSTVDWAEMSLIPYEALDVILYNVDTALYQILKIKSGWQDAKGALVPVLANIKEFTDIAGSALDFMAKAGGVTVDWSATTRVTVDAMQTIAWNVDMLLGQTTMMIASWVDTNGELVAVLGQVKAFADSASSAVGLMTDAAGAGEAMALAQRVTVDALRIASDNIQLIVAEVAFLASGWTDAEGKLMPVLEAVGKFAGVAGDAVGLMSDAGGLGEAIEKSKPASRSKIRQIAQDLSAVVTILAEEFAGVSDAMRKDLASITASAGPVVELISSALEAFDPEKLLKSGFFRARQGRSSSSFRASRTWAQGYADQVKAGIVLMFDTLASALANIKAPGSETVAKVNGLVAAYSPILDLIKTMNEIEFDMTKLRMLAQVPGILAGGLIGQGGAGQGAPGAGQSGAGAILLTGPVTLTGSLIFQGTQYIDVYLDGAVIQRTATTGTFDQARSRHSQTAP